MAPASPNGQLRNDSPNGWKDVELEVRYFNKQGRNIDTQTTTLFATVPPGEAHAFRLRGPADKPESFYARHKVLVRWARDAQSLR